MKEAHFFLEVKVGERGWKAVNIVIEGGRERKPSERRRKVGKRSKEGGYREVVFRFLQMLGRNHWYFSLYIQASPISLTPC